MARTEGDFEKGELSGSRLLMRIIGQTARRWQSKAQTLPAD
jgi:hypothetical protein